MTFPIEKGVPLPEIKNRPTGLEATMRQMEVGDSFLYHHANMGGAPKRVGIKTATKAEMVNGVKMYRVWRTE